MKYDKRVVRDPQAGGAVPFDDPSGGAPQATPAQDAVAAAAVPPQGVPPQDVGGGSLYPLFRDPERYLRLREGKPGFRRAKQYFEHRAILRCIKDLSDIRTVCDVPCGPGRLFRLWKSLGLAVLGIDLSREMVAEAMTRHRGLGLAGWVRRADVFRLAFVADSDAADVVACVRFCYYFPRPTRVQLLRVLAQASRQYVLVQYKTRQTPRGAWNWFRQRLKARRRPSAKHHCTHADVREDARRAGLEVVRICPISFASDRVFVLLKKHLGKPERGA